jgi:hypothetical protein
MNDDRWATLWLIIAVAGMVAAWAFLASVQPSRAHDHDHPEYNEWMAGLMQPDNPTASCCGKSDAYWCDDYYAKNGKAYCRITDDRTVTGRPPVPVGTEIEIPDRKLKWEQGGRPIGNPTGHAIVFLSSGGAVFCFVQSGGV